MYTTYQISEQELNIDFLESVKRLFKNKKLAITIEESLDETEYLLSNPANKKRLLNSINNIEKGKNLKTVNIKELKKKVA